MNLKKYIRIILLFPIKLPICLFCTLFLPLVWVFEDELTIYDYFHTWKCIFLEIDIYEDFDD